MNAVQLIGHVASEVEYRTLSTGSRVAQFVLMVGRPNGLESDFFWIKAWEGLADAIEQLGRGRMVAIEGTLRQDWVTTSSRNVVLVLARKIGVLETIALSEVSPEAIIKRLEDPAIKMMTGSTPEDIV